jgi:ATP-dependent Clp protease protease subunit
MIDEIDNIRKTNPGIKIATIVTGKAMSAGAVLLTCGDEGLRFAAPNATIMIHDVASSSGGKVSDLKNDAAEADRLNETIFSRMEKNIGKEKGYLSSIVHLKGHTDWFMGPEEALTHNIINKIGNPSLKVEINVTLRLE